MEEEMDDGPGEISRQTKTLANEDGSSIEYVLVVHRQEEGGQHRLVHVLEYKGISTEISPDEEFLDQHAHTFIEMVDTGLFEGDSLF